ncbi:glycosyl hydrolase family 95 catalytic domain-containing protein [Thomasclavelia cocleata]|uniref:glycosyl hydrolase family 95 catalytic domain-containing protein n=8 Tax=Thomasclavelia cocleata TaxID=69824 RepID=UPI00242C8ECF|nr:glycoside hydrolase N-terminal domain-containing protein [Thomasclavelia cocleata]
MKKVLLIIVSLLMIVPVLPIRASVIKNDTEKKSLSQSDNNKLRMWYDEPGTMDTWEETGLVIGNGKTGGILFGQVAKDQIHFNEKTLWSGGPSSSRPNYNGGNKKSPVTSEQLEELRVRADDHSSSVFPLGTSLDYVMGDGNGMGKYQDFGDLYLDFSITGMTNDNVKNYVRDLDMETGISSLQYDYKDVHYTREYFVSHPDGVMAIRLTASKEGKLSFNASTKAASGLQTRTVSENGKIRLFGTVADNQMKCEMQTKIYKDGNNGSVVCNSDGTISVKDADAITIVLATGTDYKNTYPSYRGEDPFNELTDIVESASSKTYEELKENHLNDYCELFNRVELDLGGRCPNIPTDQLMAEYRKGNYNVAVEEMVYQFGRYLTIASSCQGDELPSNLCGIWLIGDAGKYWGADFHFNVNVQMNYWPVFSTNLAECGTVFNDYMKSLVEPGRVTAKMSAGIETETGTPIGDGNGFLVNTQNNPFGTTAPFGGQEYGWNIGGSSWSLQNVYDYYLFTEDKTYLENEIYPMLKEMANFWNEFLWYSEYQDRLVVGPSVSAEQGPTVNGTTYDQSIVWELYKMAIDASKILGVDENERKVWQEKQAKLNPVIIGDEGQVKEWFEETTLGKGKAGNLAETNIPNFGAGGSANQGAIHRHTSQLIGLFPGTLINKDTTEWMNAAVKSLEQRSLNGTGWSKAMKINMYARTGLAEETYSMVRAMCAGNKNGIMNNLLDSHPPFQIDGNFGLTAGMTEMLLQSQLGYVEFLPALPEAWSNGSVQGIKARGNFTVGETWSNGLAKTFTVRYDGDKADREFIGEYSNIANAKVFVDGHEVEFETEASDRISFTAQKGKVYTIDLSEANFDQIKDKAQDYLTEIHQDLIKLRDELKEAVEKNDPLLVEVLEKAQFVNKMYCEYIDHEEEIYYMTIKEGLTYDDIDDMYNELRTIRKCLINNDKNIEQYDTDYEILSNIFNVLDEQMTNREIIFSKDSGVIDNRNYTVTLTKNAEASHYQLRYTLDGSEPNNQSSLYKEAISLAGNQETTLRAALFFNSQRVSPIYTKRYVKLKTVNQIINNNDFWDGYPVEKMIDNNLSTRWASKAPIGDIELEFQFALKMQIDTILFDQFVSVNNASDKFEIWAMTDDQYEKIYTGSNLGNNSIATSSGHCVNKVSFDTVNTDKMKVVIKEGYLKEPSFWEIQFLNLKEDKDGQGNFEHLNSLITLSENVNRNDDDYINVKDSLKAAFEESILDAKDACKLSQCQMDLREEFLKNRYNRLDLNEADKTLLIILVEEAQQELEKPYTQESLYQLKKVINEAQVLLNEEDVKQSQVNKIAELLQNALMNLEGNVQTVVIPSSQLSGGSKWLDVKGFKATNDDDAGLLTYEFEGQSIEVTTVKAADHGILHVVITNSKGDIVVNENIDTYAQERVEGTMLFSKELLQDKYTISFEKNGKSQQATNGWVEVGTLTIQQSLDGKVDRISLERELETCYLLKEEDYTPNSWNEFKTIFDKAKEVYEKLDNQTCTLEMNDTAEELKNVREKLINKANKEALLKTIEEAGNKDLALYTNESVEKLSGVLDDANAILENENAIQSDVDSIVHLLNTAIEDLKYKDADYTLVNEAIARAEALDKNQYEDFSIVEEAINAVIRNLDITKQSEVNDMAKAINEAIDALVKKPEILDVSKIALQIAVEMAGNVTAEDLDKVVPAVVTEFNAALEEARAILANDNATQEEVDASFARLSVAMHMLEFLKGDKAELQDLVDSTADLVEGNYTEESWSALQDALTEANTVLNNENAMQEEVDEAYDNLQAAINGLEEVEVVDKSLLEAMVNKVLGLEEDKYIASSWQAMLPELEAAQEVLGNEKATQAEVDEACDALTRGYLNLRLKPNKDLLQSLINKANGLNSASYTADTWAVVADEVMKAQAVLEDPEASEAEVKAAHAALTKALEGLEAKPGNTVDTSTPVKPGDTTASIKPGDTTNMMYPLLGLAIASLGIYGNKKKIK